MVNPLTTWARDGEVEIDSAVYHAHTWFCGYANIVAGASWGHAHHYYCKQHREEAYHGEGTQVR